MADYVTKKLLDARSAVWVAGGRKRGVMMATPTWAFAGMEDARKFMAENGGYFDSFDQVMNSATMEVREQAEQERAVQNEMVRELR